MSEAGPSERLKSSQHNTQSRPPISPRNSLVLDNGRRVVSVGSTNNHLWICRVCEVRRSSRRDEICAKCRMESLNQFSARNSANPEGTPNRRRVVIHQSSPPNVQAPSQTKRPESTHQETLIIDPGSSEYESDGNESDFDEMIETIQIPSAMRRTTYRSQPKPRSQPKSTSQPNPDIIIDISRNRRNGHYTYYRRSAQTQYSMGKQKVVHHTSDSVTAKKRSKTQTMGSLPTQPMASRRYHTENSLSQPFGSAVVGRNIESEPEPEPEPESEPDSDSDPDAFFDFNVLPKPAPDARTLEESIGYDYYAQSIIDKRTRRSRPTPDDSVPIMPTRIQYVPERNLVVSRNKPSRRSQPISYSPSTMNKYYSTSFSRRPDIYKSGETGITINSSGKRPSSFPSYWGPSYPPETDVATAPRKGNSKAPRSKEEPTTSPEQENLQGLEGRDIPYPSRYPLSSSSISPQHVVSGTPNPFRAWLPADEGYYAFSAGEPCILQSSVPLGKPIFDAKPDTELRTMEDNMGTEDKSVDTAKSLDSGISREPLGNVVDESEPAQLVFPSSEPTEDLEDLNQASEDIQAILTKRSTIEESEDEIDHRYQYRSSLSSSYAASIASSVFSKGSLASSATDISRGSGYSVDQIATATKLLLSILHEDLILLPLYKSAVDNPDIGPERLQRNLSRIFKAYSKLLEAEATERLEYLTSKLVLAKSAFLARSIVEKLRSARQNPRIPCSEHLNDSSDEDDDGKFEETPLINEEVFQDLVVFREFLIESEAFRSLRARVQAFVMPKSTDLPKSSGIEEEESFKNDAVQSCLINQAAQPKSYQTWQNWIEDFKNTIDGLFHSPNLMEAVKNAIFLIAHALILATDDLLITISQLEPPLRPGMVRLRWRCSCGDFLYSDVTELRPGGVSDLIRHMQRTSGAKVHASPYNQRTNNQKYIALRPFQWVRNAFQKVESVVGRATRPSTCLPQHNTQCPINALATPSNPAPQQGTLHLLACMHRDRLRKVLHQDPIENVMTDRTLVCFLRKQYIRHRGRILHMLSLKTIKGVLFVKFRLPIGGSVDVRHHDPCCVAASVGAMTCECIPPSTKVEPSPGAEYQCIPGPPATYPPIPPEYLSSLITCPTDVHEKDTWILDQLPKRTCGELQGQIGKPAEGWGIYYQEGWDRDAIALVVLVVFIIASLLFGILWSRFKYDVQGAFGVSAYMIACCAVLIPVLSTRAEKMG